MIKIQREYYVNITQEIDDLAPELSREVDIYPDVAEPNIDHDKLIAMEEAVLAVTARDEDDELVGFTVSILTSDVLFKHVLTSYSIIYYLKPEHRGGGNGKRLFVETEKWYDYFGVERSVLPRKLHLDNQKLFQDLDYMPIEINYTKSRGN